MFIFQISAFDFPPALNPQLSTFFETRSPKKSICWSTRESRGNYDSHGRHLRHGTHRVTLWRMKFPTVIYQDEDGMWIVECPAIPGCVSQGRTREEAMDNIKKAIALCLEVRAERGMPLMFKTSDVVVAV